VARRILTGLQKAAIVFYISDAVRRQMETFGIVDPARLVKAQPGISSEFRLDGPKGGPPDLGDRPYVLHVGSCIPRKRIDVLLATFAAVRRSHPDLALLQIGGEWSDTQREQLRELKLDGAVVQVRGLTRDRVAAAYGGALLVLQPSDAEGFGLPVVEALACGAVVVASDIPVLREVGGPAAVYCPVGDVDAWSATVTRLLDHPAEAPGSGVRREQATLYSWERQGQTIVEAYRKLLGERRPCASST
jgi:glycosyltransferase involved in cell wall biosynthesis